MLRSLVSVGLAAAVLGDVDRSQTAHPVDLYTQLEGLRDTMEIGLASAKNDAEKAAFNASMTATTALYNHVQIVGDGVASRMAAMNAAMDALQDRMDASMDTQLSTNAAAMSTNIAQQEAAISTASSNFMAMISTQMDAASSNTAAFQAAVNTRIEATDGKLAAATECNGMGKFLNVTTGQCQAFSSMTLARSSAASCSVTGAIRINSATNRVEACASNKWWAPIPHMHNFRTHGGEGCENCWLNRQLTFTKKLTDTYIRVMWTDTGRSHGWGDPWNRYYLRVCDAAGNHCGDCQDPGQMRVTRRMNQWHGWWSDHYMPFGTVALCRRRNNVNMGPGTYRLRIWCDGRDSNFGWSGSTANIQIDEVYKA